MTNDNLIDLLYSYPLYFATEDYYLPELAAPLLRGLEGLDDESAQVSIKLYAMDAVRRLEWLVN